MAFESDLLNPDVWVIDTGGSFDPDVRNFDHHQNKEQFREECALTLLLQSVMPPGQYAALRAVQPWLRLTSVHDSQGPVAAAGFLGLDMRAYNATKSPVERAMLHMFSDQTVIPADGSLMRVMIDIGRGIFADARDVFESCPERLAEAPGPVDHRNLRVWDLRSVYAEGIINTSVINMACAQRGVDLVLTMCGKSSPGCMQMYRQPPGADKLDLFGLSGEVGVRYAHKNGFYAILEGSVDDTTIAALIERARKAK